MLWGDQCVYCVDGFDPLSARIAEDLGFGVGMLYGAVATATVLGAPNLVILTSSDLAQQASRISRASNISLMVDADHGYGNALNVMRTVEELENAGASALTVNDSAQPIGFGIANGEEPRGTHSAIGTGPTPDLLPMVSLEEAAGKIKAALAARQDPSMVIVARTNALPLGGIPEAIRRVKEYEKAGVDALYMARSTREGLEAVHAATNLPLLTGRGSVPLGDKRSLAALRVRISAAGPLSLWASVQAVYEILSDLRDGKTANDLRPRMASRELVVQSTRLAHYNEWIKNFLN